MLSNTLLYDIKHKMAAKWAIREVIWLKGLYE